MVLNMQFPALTELPFECRLMTGLKYRYLTLSRVLREAVILAVGPKCLVSFVMRFRDACENASNREGNICAAQRLSSTNQTLRGMSKSRPQEFTFDGMKLVTWPLDRQSRDADGHVGSRWTFGSFKSTESHRGDLIFK
jgi:hypothetical protein